ncbi:MAG: glycine cleavage system protein R [Rhodocyclaceae bacterium]|jgi:glycine cleavage system regulatory protein|nr:glycine cleavage system protein R [Rhodocyclaceae bacterium]MBK6553119.1 glycine cleavage system protein R [Rhodocyclaceae bacterium]MBK9311440.1 glycine cleavage system protein R [Rhodocyclaceae bacterium]
MADTHLILTTIGDDRPGLVGELSAVISAHQGNWLESSMSRLAGKFAGIVKVAMPGDKVEALKAALAGLASLKVIAETSADAKSAAAGRRLKLSLIGHDRIGIVREVSQVLARHAVNVEELSTRTASAPMSAEIMFHADIDLLAGHEIDARALTAELERISNDLMVDINLDEKIA